MDAGENFSIGFRTFNKHEKTGGEFIFIPDAVKHNHLTAAERKSGSNVVSVSKVVSRNPNHYENSTRNIRVIANGRIIKIHLRLVTDFNNKKVL